MELIDGRGVLPASTTQSPTFGQQTLTHPLYRSSSQDDFNTIERNARKKLFPSSSTMDDGNYPTILKMEQQQKNRQSPSKSDVILMHKENEKKSPARQIKELIEDKLLTKSNSNASTKQKPNTIDTSVVAATDDTGKGLKFGIRVLPMSSSNVNDTIQQQQQQQLMEKIPSKVQNDNDETTLPVVNKRTKTTTIKSDRTTIMNDTNQLNNEIEFQRQCSITSSGIRRDAAGIPQEMPNEMMQAALAARDNRKSLANNFSNDDAMTTALVDGKKSKGKAPNPPSPLLLSDDVTDAIGENVTQYTMLTDDIDSRDNTKNLSDTSSPISDRKIMGSDTESHHAGYDHGKIYCFKFLSYYNTSSSSSYV